MRQAELIRNQCPELEAFLIRTNPDRSFASKRGNPDMPTLLDEYLQGYNIPICYDFPVSHDESWNYPMIEGCPVSLTVGADQVTLQFQN